MHYLRAISVAPHNVAAGPATCIIDYMSVTAQLLLLLMLLLPVTWLQGLLDVIASDDNAPIKVVRLRIVDDSGAGGAGGGGNVLAPMEGDEMGDIKAQPGTDSQVWWQIDCSPAWVKRRGFVLQTSHILLP